MQLTRMYANIKKVRSTTQLCRRLRGPNRLSGLIADRAFRSTRRLNRWPAAQPRRFALTFVGDTSVHGSAPWQKNALRMLTVCRIIVRAVRSAAG